MSRKEKTLGNTNASRAKDNVPDVVFYGNGDAFKLVSKASSHSEGWMKSTKAMQMPDGCLVQVTTQQRNLDGTYAVAEALTYVPGAIVVMEEEGVSFTSIDHEVSKVHTAAQAQRLEDEYIQSSMGF